MKTLASLCIVALLILIAGCSENSVNPIAAPSSANPISVSRTIQLNQRIDFTTPEGMSTGATLEGEITYQLFKVDRAALSKEVSIAPRTSYRLILAGQGEMSFTEGAASPSLRKPITWTFSKTLTDIVDDGGEYTATFPMNGTRYQLAHLHLGFVVSANQLVRDVAYVDFHVDGGE